MFFFFQAEDGIRDLIVTGVQTCALPVPRVRGGRVHRTARHGTHRAGLAHRSGAGRGPGRGAEPVVDPAHHREYPGPRHAGARVHRGGPLPAAVPGAQGEAVRSGVPLVPPPGAAGPAEPSIFGGGLSHRDAGRLAGIRRALRGGGIGGCRAGRVGDAHVARSRVGGGRPGGAAPGGAARGVREHRELRRRTARVSRAQTHDARDPTVPLSDGTMSITVLGANHRTAPLEVRERFAHTAGGGSRALERVVAAGGRGGVLLSTWNRTEFSLAEADVTPPADE